MILPNFTSFYLIPFCVTSAKDSGTKLLSKNFFFSKSSDFLLHLQNLHFSTQFCSKVRFLSKSHWDCKNENPIRCLDVVSLSMRIRRAHPTSVSSQKWVQRENCNTGYSTYWNQKSKCPQELYPHTWGMAGTPQISANILRGNGLK